MSEHQGYCFPSLGEPCGNCHRCTPAAPGTGLGLSKEERVQGKTLPAPWHGRWFSQATVERIVAARVAEAKAETERLRGEHAKVLGWFNDMEDQAIKEEERADALMEATHVAADELDEWDGHASTTLGGCSPGGVVRHEAHRAAGVEIDECPACARRTRADRLAPDASPGGEG